MRVAPWTSCSNCDPTAVTQPRVARQRVFRLNGVPEDEAQALRALLGTHGIDFHETGAGVLGIGVAGVWVEADQADAARALIAQWQDDYGAMQREHAETLPWWQHLRERPLYSLALLLAVALVVYFTIVPFYSLIS